MVLTVALVLGADRTLRDVEAVVTRPAPVGFAKVCAFGIELNNPALNKIARANDKNFFKKITSYEKA